MGEAAAHRASGTTLIRGGQDPQAGALLEGLVPHIALRDRAARHPGHLVSVVEADELDADVGRKPVTRAGDDLTQSAEVRLARVAGLVQHGDQALERDAGLPLLLWFAFDQVRDLAPGHALHL